MTQLLITRPLPDAVIDRAKKRFEVTVREDNAPMTTIEMQQSLQDFDAVLPTLGDLYSAGLFASIDAIRTRILANFGVGYNHIDADAAEHVGITVTNTPGAVTDATADIAMTLILMSARRAAEGERLVRSGRWNGWHPTQLLGLHLSGKTVGIIGIGRIGEAIARRCHFGFGMEVLYHNRSTKPVDFPATQVSDLQELAFRSDILVAAVPGGVGTYHLVNKAVLGAMKPHAHFINISRGEVVDETALIQVLQEGEIGGAGLDVYEHEPVVPNALKALDNVTLLPHMGTAALEVRESMGLMAVDNLIAFFEGQRPPNAVNYV